MGGGVRAAGPSQLQPKQVHRALIHPSLLLAPTPSRDRLSNSPHCIEASAGKGIV